MDQPPHLVLDDYEAVISKLRSSHAAISAVLLSSIAAERDLADTGRRLHQQRRSFASISGSLAQFHSRAIPTKALHVRINRAGAPALSLLERRLVALAGAEHFGEYVDCVDRLSAAISLTAESEPVSEKLQEVVDYLWHTKAADPMRRRRLKEVVMALRSVCQQEVGVMRYEVALDEAIVRLQDEYKKMLRRLWHTDAGECGGGGWKTDGKDRLARGMDCPDWPVLGSKEDKAVLRRMTETMASNGHLHICIDIFVKVRHRRATKALTRLNLDCLNKHTPKDIDRMEWEGLEAALSLWVRLFPIAVTSVLPAEKELCRAVLSSVVDAVWLECFAKISHRIMLVFFRFGESVALSSNEPHKLFKLLKMSETCRQLHPVLSALFDDAAPEISSRARELENLLVGSAFRAFSEFGLHIDDNKNSSATPTNTSVPSVVCYAVNYLKCLTAEEYAQAMANVLRAERILKGGFLAPLKESFTNVLDALQRNVEVKRELFKDRIAANVFAMNTNWYLYTSSRGSELAMLVGEEEMRRRYKEAAEAAAYEYQVEAWEPLMRMLERGKVEAFMNGMVDNLRRHRRRYKIQDADLRGQIKEEVVKMVIPAYEGFFNAYSGMVQWRDLLPVEDIRAMLDRTFEGGGGEVEMKRGKKVADEMMAAATATAVALTGRERARRWRSRSNVRLQFNKEVET